MESVRLFLIVKRQFCAIEDICLCIMEYAQKNLWEYPSLNTGANAQARSYKNFDEYVQDRSSIIMMPVHFEWMTDSYLFANDDDPYVGDVLILDFLSDYSVWIRVSKDEQDKVRQYLHSCNILKNSFCG